MRARTLLAGGLAAGVVAALVLRPLAHGVPGTTVVVFWATVLGQAVVPGVLLCHGARLCGRRDPWLVLGQGATVGLALQGLSLLAGRALGAPWLPSLVAVSAVLAAIALGRHTAPAQPEAAPAAPAATLAVVLGAVLLQPLFSTARIGEPVPFDLLFHAGTAGELRHRWPLEDPRLAGLPLHYHLLSYALPVEAADRAGAPLLDPLLALAPLLWVALLVLQLANAGRVLFRNGKAGALGAAVAVFHADPGRLVGLGPGAFNSHLPTGVYGSPSTVCGLLLLAGIAVALHGSLSGRRRHLLELGVLAAAASAAKTTVLPLVAAGLAVCAVQAVSTGRRGQARRWAVALGVVAAGGAPLSLWQASAPDGYAGMVGLAPAAAFTSSRFAVAAAEWAGSPGAAALWAVPAFLAWLAGYLGLAGVAAAVWLVRRRGPLEPMQGWALAVAGAGAALALSLDVPGLSQLFLFYNGQLLLCLFAGAGLGLACRRPATAAGFALSAAVALAALPPAHGLALALPAAVRADLAVRAAQPVPVRRDYLDGLAWLRTRASRGAVVFADNPSLLLSAIGEVRLYYENGAYSARAWKAGPSREPWPERRALQERLLRRPDREAVDEARRAVGPGPRLLVVADHVPSPIGAGFVHPSPRPVPGRPLLPGALFERRFANGALHVYEAREESAAVSR